ncbi:MAG TPA: outer membrane beta-barrel protein [Bacteroidales bacterium]|nr:outer membrane beta-barrel protein [Bacteroidales bacterium]
MKKTILCLSALLLTGLAVNAQLTKVGGSLSYNTGYYYNLESHPEKPKDHKTGNPVISLTGIYEISLPVHFKPSLNIYMPRITKEDYFEGSSKRVISAFSLDLDGHYVFNSLDRFEFYGLAGANILWVKMKTKEEFPGSDSMTFSGNNTSLGLNLGVGSYFRLKDEFDLFFELKAIIASQVRFAGTAGILLNVDWMKKHENDEL